MKLMKKVVVVFLAVCMLLLTGCGGNAANDKKRTSATKKESKNWETVDAYSEDKVVDLKGYEFTIASPYLKDDDSGTTAQDIVFRAAVDAVEAQYNCKIKVINLVCDLPNLQVKIMSGDKVADLLDINPASLVGGINAGYIRPMESIKGIDYNDKRWVKGYTQIGMLKDKHYGLNFMRPAEVRWCMFYNKDILKSAGITDNIADLVRNKKWTFDKFEEFAKKTTKDTNNDGKNDIFGLMCSYPYTAGTLFANANGARSVSIKNNVAKQTFTEQNYRDALNYYNKLVNEDKVVKVYDEYCSDSAQDGVSVGIQDLSANFLGGKAAFWLAESWVGNQYIATANSSIDYGMVPMPMGPSAKDYVSPASFGRVFAFTSTNNDLDKAVPIFNALARFVRDYGDGDDSWWKNEIAHDYFREGDKDSLDMYLLCLDKTMLDLGSTIGINIDDKVVKNSIYLKQGTTDAQLSSIEKMFDQAISVFN